MKHLRGIIWTIAVLLAWEVLGRLQWLAGRAFPPPSAILGDWVTHADVYLIHIGATLRSASLGFLFGVSISVAAAFLFVLFPLFERLTRGISITLFAVPPITIGPILVLVFSGAVPQVVLAATCVYFPAMISALLGLRDIDPRPVDVIETYGGGRWAVLRFVRARAALPGILVGLKVAAPAAMLGAILGEFGAGTRWGLGSFLLGSLGQANPGRIWGIGLAATLVAGLFYALFALISRRLLGTTTQVTVAANSAPDRLGTAGPAALLPQILLGLASLAMPFLAWWTILKLLAVNPIIARDPIATFDYLFLSDRSAIARNALASAFASTLPAAFAGMVLGLAAAFLLAVLSVLRPAIARALMPPALVLQTMPLVALTPIIVLVFGRDLAAILAVTVSVVFFPAFVTLAQGLATVPRAALDVVRTYGERPVKSLWLVSIPFAMPYLFAAARLVAPRALLGAMIAEWLATGTGVGQLLNASRGMMDYGMIWATACVSVIVAVLAYHAVGLVERFVWRH